MSPSLSLPFSILRRSSHHTHALLPSPRCDELPSVGTPRFRLNDKINPPRIAAILVRHGHDEMPVNPLCYAMGVGELDRPRPVMLTENRYSLGGLRSWHHGHHGRQRPSTS